MLARTEPDFEVKRPIVAEQASCTDLTFGTHCDLRKQLVDQVLLPLPKLVSARPPVKAVEGEGIAGFVGGHGAKRLVSMSVPGNEKGTGGRLEASNPN
jgi:hypothetical protein